MQNLARLAFLLAAVLSALTHASAQGFSVESKSPPSLTGSESFTSLEGRFTVALPQEIAGFSPISFDTPKGKVTVGDSYSWRLQDAQFEIGYMDTPTPVTSAEEAKAKLRGGADSMIAGGTAKGWTLVSRADISQAGNAGHQFKMETPQIFIITRLYAVNQRVYQLTAAFKKDPQVQESAVKALDSFKLLTPADVDTAIQKKVAEATPSPLPQEPVAPKPKSDAEDEGLKGKVKEVSSEDGDLSGTWAVGRRKPTRSAHYNERGNVVRTVTYDWKGNPFDFNAYGYIDGDRASKYNSIRYEYDPPPVMAAPSPAGVEKPKSDPRYSIRYKYKYDEKGRQVEIQRYRNDGRLAGRTVRSFKDGQVETLAYNADKELVDKRVETLDAKGNVIETIYFDVRTDTVRTRYSYVYDSFDAQGNWVKKTTSKWMTKDGKSFFEPSYVTFRIITYY